MPAPHVDLNVIRTIILTAVASDEVLMNALVFKGGNALELIYKIGQRASLDLDFSTAADFENIDDVKARLFRALHDRFDSAGFVLFDEKFGPRPKNRAPGARWGGYNAEFKLITKALHKQLQGKIEDIRIQALECGPGEARRFRIEISSFEYCDGKSEVEVEGYTCFVYTAEMIAIEKLRAICQQIPGYRQRVHPTPRARDFYDIHSIITATSLDLASPTACDLVRKIFEAKEVDLAFLGKIHEQRDFHRPDWASVVTATPGGLREFDYYFDSVLGEIEKLKPLWVV